MSRQARGAPPRRAALVPVIFFALGCGGGGPTAEQLRAKAADPAGAAADRERAALALADKGAEGKEALKTLLKSATEPGVKAAAVSGLAALDAWDSVPLLLDAMDDPAEAVRARAGAAVAKFVGKDFGFKASAPPDERRAVLAVVRAEYAKMAKSPPPRYQKSPSP
ncbi:MAG: hypothetical protein C0501_02235 [Isosphaera sp.]|nr:hypothetical protein [Isosphaera sp.]